MTMEQPTPKTRSKVVKLASGDRVTLADRAVALVRRYAHLFHDQDGDPFAAVELGGRQFTYRVRSVAFRELVQGLFYGETGKALSGQALRTAVDTIGAAAGFDGPRTPVHVRFASVGSEIWFDLGNDDSKVVRINPSGWTVATASPTGSGQVLAAARAAAAS